MITPANDVDDRFARSGPVVHHLAIGQANHDVPQLGGSTIPFPIGLEPIG